MISMDIAVVKKWVIFFLGIVIAIVIADYLSRLIMSVTGMTGWMEFVISFILYAALFFGLLYAIEKLLGIEYFGFGRA
ncbi:MAG: hypothetical protein LUQ31_07945 [Methanoregula sp.]|nr:hypothetical protein [Methanoregula sp.]